MTALFCEEYILVEYFLIESTASTSEPPKEGVFVVTRDNPELIAIKSLEDVNFPIKLN